MNHRSPLLRTAALAVATLALGGTASLAQTAGDTGTGTLTANVNQLVGAGRSVLSVAATPMATTANELELDSTFSTTILEAGAAGADWSVTLGLDELKIATTTTTIPTANVGISGRATTNPTHALNPIASGITITEGSTGTDLGAAVTLFGVNNEVATSVYNGAFAHTANLTLTVPNGATVGVYTGTLTVTIFE